MDEVLFAALKDGFDEYVTNAIPFEKPNVIFTDLGEDEWPVGYNKWGRSTLGRGNRLPRLMHHNVIVWKSA